MASQPQEDRNPESYVAGCGDKTAVKRIIRLVELLSKADRSPMQYLSVGEKTQKR